MLCVRASVANKAAPCCPVAGGRLCASRMLRRCKLRRCGSGPSCEVTTIAAMEGSLGQLGNFNEDGGSWRVRFLHRLQHGSGETRC